MLHGVPKSRQIWIPGGVPHHNQQVGGDIQNVRFRSPSYLALDANGGTSSQRLGCHGSSSLFNSSEFVTWMCRLPSPVREVRHL